MLPCIWGKANFSPKNWLKSLGLGSHPRLKGNHILNVACYIHCRPSILPLNTCIYPMGVTLTHRSHMASLGSF